VTSRRLYLENARLVDGTGAPARDGAILIEGDTIVHAGPLSAADAPGGADVQVVDVGGRTVIQLITRNFS
jgi:imidazolonepropionase-like amidohydrolase